MTNRGSSQVRGGDDVETWGAKSREETRWDVEGKKPCTFGCKAEKGSTVAVADGYYVVREERQKIRILDESLELGVRMDGWDEVGTGWWCGQVRVVVWLTQLWRARKTTGFALLHSLLLFARSSRLWSWSVRHLHKPQVNLAILGTASVIVFPKLPSPSLILYCSANGYYHSRPIWLHISTKTVCWCTWGFWRSILLSLYH